MRKSTQLLLVVAAVFALAIVARADPIGTRDGQCYSAVWVQARQTDCDLVCRHVGKSAESMTLSSVSTQKIFVCRYKGDKYYAFGEQGSGNCRVLDGSTPSKQLRYECLCVSTGCIADTPESRPGQEPAPSGPPSNKVSEEECLTSLKARIEREGIRPDRETYAKAQRYCARGDLRGALRVIMRGNR